MSPRAKTGRLVEAPCWSLWRGCLEKVGGCCLGYSSWKRSSDSCCLGRPIPLPFFQGLLRLATWGLVVSWHRWHWVDASGFGHLRQCPEDRACGTLSSAPENALNGCSLDSLCTPHPAQVPFFLFVVFVVYTLLPFSMQGAVAAGVISGASHLLVIAVLQGTFTNDLWLQVRSCGVLWVLVSGVSMWMQAGNWPIPSLGRPCSLLAQDSCYGGEFPS